MHAKIVTFEMKPGKRAEVIRLFRDFIVPGAEKQRGFRGGLFWNLRSRGVFPLNWA